VSRDGIPDNAGDSQNHERDRRRLRNQYRTAFGDGAFRYDGAYPDHELLLRPVEVLDGRDDQRYVAARNGVTVEQQNEQSFARKAARLHSSKVTDGVKHELHIERRLAVEEAAECAGSGGVMERRESSDRPALR
jgi:hypothetical protein